MLNFFSFNIILLAFAILLTSNAKPLESIKTTSSPDISSFDLDDFFGATGDGHFANMDVDGVETMLPKKTEKMPGQKKMKPEFVAPPGVIPEFTGSFEAVGSDKPATDAEDSSDIDYFSDSSATGPVTNPASTFLEGGDFEKMSQPECQMLGCTGPIPNDGSYATLSSEVEGKSCSQLFVPMNGCTNNKGYPMGMLCSVCCDCSNSFKTEMRKTFGYKSNLSTSSFNA